MPLYFPVTDVLHQPLQVVKLKVKSKRKAGTWKEGGRFVYEAWNLNLTAHYVKEYKIIL